jgi:hypothetical protein
LHLGGDQDSSWGDWPDAATVAAHGHNASNGWGALMRDTALGTWAAWAWLSPCVVLAPPAPAASAAPAPAAKPPLTPQAPQRGVRLFSP